MIESPGRSSLSPGGQPAVAAGSSGASAHEPLPFPTAVLPLGLANGANPVPFLTPCHRVIRQSGELGGYHWGETRKQAMHAWEVVRQQVQRWCAGASFFYTTDNILGVPADFANGFQCGGTSVSMKIGYAFYQYGYSRFGWDYRK